MHLRATACFAAVFAATLGGCGTVVNCIDSSGLAPREIYGGVKQDAQKWLASSRRGVFRTRSLLFPDAATAQRGPRFRGQDVLRWLCRRHAGRRSPGFRRRRHLDAPSYRTGHADEENPHHLAESEAEPQEQAALGCAAETSTAVLDSSPR